MLGNGLFGEVTPPAAVLGGPVYTDIESGYGLACAAQRSGAVSCWGNGRYLGRAPMTENSASPLEVPGLDAIVSASTQYSGVCAVDEAGQLFCWGSEWATGEVTPEGSSEPVQVTMLEAPVAQLECGHQYCCALLETGALDCWGYNDAGALGYEGRGDSLTPVRIDLGAPEGFEVAQLSAGATHNCVLGRQGEVRCWGDNHSDQCGQVSAGTIALPSVKVPLPEAAVWVSAGGYHSCAVGVSGWAWCWGATQQMDYHGQLGHGERSASGEPVEVMDRDDLVQISAGEEHTCALAADRRIWCWGANDGGQVLPPEAGHDYYLPAEVTLP